MKLFKIIFLNIGNYGVIEYIKMFFYEIFYLLNSEYRKHFFHDESATNAYEEIDLNNQSSIFNGSYNPTPIYHLKLIEKVLKKKICQILLLLILVVELVEPHTFLEKCLKK